MKIKTAIYLFCAVLIVLFGSIFILLLITSNRVDEESIKIRDAAEEIRLAKNIKEHLLIHDRNAFLIGIDKDVTRIKNWENERNEILDILNLTNRFVNGEREKKLFKNIKEEMAIYFGLHDKIPSGTTYIDRYTSINKQVEKIIISIDKLVEVNHSQMQGLLSELKQKNTISNRLSITLSLFYGLAILTISIGILFTIYLPLIRLSEIIRRYSLGETQLRAEVNGLDEVKKVISKFNLMADRIEDSKQSQINFLASIAHDLRNPLNSISMASELLVKKSTNSESKIASVIAQQVQHMDRLVGDLLETVQIEAGQLELKFTKQDLKNLISHAVELQQVSSELHRFELYIPENEMWCCCDGDCISQVLNNLLTNALKYSPNGGTVTVRGKKEQNQYVISIEDQGIGISPEELENIFKPFHRSKNTRNTIPGIGLGLSSSRRILKGHKGNLTAENLNGKGAKFEMILPVNIYESDTLKMNEDSEDMRTQDCVGKTALLT